MLIYAKYADITLVKMGEGERYADITLVKMVATKLDISVNKCALNSPHSKHTLGEWGKGED